MAQNTPKGYWIGHVTVDDPQAYDAYRQANAEAFAKYNARFLVRGGAQEVVEGALRPRAVVIEFPSMAAARACYESAEYQRALALRAPVSMADLCIVEGWPG
ncbi:DUF1330 domain-containing protein [Phaeovulum sp.]|uniref:DUF1330 domain-containing protein n=1 Tax=Phaeovulum sp. TaxID=2934796 RepID=UPI0039E72488